jgi:hypothetical protein
LKARYLMHLQKRRDVTAEVLSLIGASVGNIGEEARLVFGNAETENWTLAKFARERPNTLVVDPRFAESMAASGDPRMPHYMAFEGGLWVYWVLDDPDLLWAADDASIPLISYAEILFLKAEANVRAGSGDASADLEAAIMASMELVGVDADSAADYVAANSSIGGLSDAQQIRKIVEEAYVAYFGHNLSGLWATVRRTGYPVLVPHPQGTNGFNPSGVVPQRYIYVESETQTNGENADAARARQSGALLDVPVWAFQ